MTPNPFTRWTPSRKQDLLDDLYRGIITELDAQVLHGVSAEELASWRRRYSAFGQRGLATTKCQTLRAPA